MNGDDSRALFDGIVNPVLTSQIMLDSAEISVLSPEFIRRRWTARVCPCKPPSRCKWVFLYGKMIQSNCQLHKEVEDWLSLLRC